MLVDHVIESPVIGLLESALMSFDIYNDAAQQALVILKQRFLYDEIEAEVTLLESSLHLPNFTYVHQSLYSADSYGVTTFLIPSNEIRNSIIFEY